jgi:hypothetical protein
MQKFKAEFKNVPTDAPQVCSSISTSLNRVEKLSETSKVLTLNNLDVDLRQHKDGQGSRVSVTAYVLNQRGRPLMPCSARKARILLKKGEAKVVRTNPFFVIQLKKPTGEQVQRIYLGVDTGSKIVGFSVITAKKEVVTGELAIDQRTKERLDERRMYRRMRRSKLWYRESRFNNRHTDSGWLPPSVQRKFNTHITLINNLRKILPIREENITIEVGNFDIQKIENPDIAGIQYQQGSLFEYQNMRGFLMAREHGKCQLCGKEFSKGNPSHIHHIIPKSQGGTDREKNLSILHKKCHIKLHKNKSYNLLRKNRTYKDASFMSIIRWKYREVFPNCKMTYGNETFVKRNELRLEKTHYNDAFIIAGGINQNKVHPLFLGQKHRNNRVLQCNRKGYKPSIRRQRYSIQPYDTVTINKRKYTSKGCRCYGKLVRYTDGINNFDTSIKKIENVFHVRPIYLIKQKEEIKNGNK